jgi:hypothetical protein
MFEVLDLQKAARFEGFLSKDHEPWSAAVHIVMRGLFLIIPI